MICKDFGESPTTRRLLSLLFFTLDAKRVELFASLANVSVVLCVRNTGRLLRS